MLAVGCDAHHLRVAKKDGKGYNIKERPLPPKGQNHIRRFNPMPKNKLEARTVAVAAIMIAVVTISTLAIRIPIPATTGYFNLSDVAIYFAAFTFGPWVGLVAGGVGTAIADAIGFPPFILISLVAHGGEGIVAGYIGRRQSVPLMLLGWLVGAIIMLSTYFAAETLWFGGLPAALTELPFNIIQNVAGGVVSIPLVFAVRRAYPPIARIGR